MGIELKQIVIVYDRDYAYIGEVVKPYKSGSVRIAYNNVEERFAANGHFHNEYKRGYFESCADLTTVEKHARAQAHNAQKLQAMEAKRLARETYETIKREQLEAGKAIIAAGRHYVIDTSAGQLHLFDIGKQGQIEGVVIMVKFSHKSGWDGVTYWAVGTTETGGAIGSTNAIGDTPELAAADIAASWYVRTQLQA